MIPPEVLTNIERAREVLEAHKARFHNDPEKGEILFDTALLCTQIGALQHMVRAGDCPESIKQAATILSKEMISTVCTLGLKAGRVKLDACESDMDIILNLVRYMAPK